MLRKYVEASAWASAKRVANVVTSWGSEVAGVRASVLGAIPVFPGGKSRSDRADARATVRVCRYNWTMAVTYAATVDLSL